MSEYQYYEFRAVDRPLTQKQIDEVSEYSTRAEITSTSFINEYHWGSFRGDAIEFVDRYFDAMVYFANWGTHRFLFRVPADLVDRATIEPYCQTDVVDLKLKQGNLILDIKSEAEDYDDYGRFQSQQERPAAPSAPRRKVSKMLRRPAELESDRKAAEAHAAAVERAKKEAQAARERAVHLDRVAGRGHAPWDEVEQLIASKSQKSYDEAIKTLTDLRDIALREGVAVQFSMHVYRLIERHSKKTSFCQRVAKANLIPKLSGSA